MTKDLGDEYFAGFFDGEGSISIDLPQGSSLYLLRLQVVNTDPTPLRLLKARYGGTVLGPFSRGPRCKSVFYWKADARVAERCLRRIAPYLVVKRARAEVALEFRRLFYGQYIVPRGLALASERNGEKRARIVDLRRAFYDRMRALNTRGA